MKRYLLFAGYDYYPTGGWCDFFNCFDSVEEAKSAIIQGPNNYDWTHIVDIEIGEIVWNSK